MNIRNTSISIRIWLVLALFTTGLVLNTYLELSSTRTEIQSCYASNVEHMVESAGSILQHFYQKAEAGELTQLEAKQRALEAISAIRYDDGNYIFMGDRDGISISNGIKELVGTNIMGIQDPTGLPLVEELYRVASEGGGFVDYQWPDSLNKSILLPKTSYADQFEPWQWTLGTGLNMAALQEDLLRIQETSLINLALVIVSIGCLIFVFMRSITRQISRVVHALTDLAEGRSNLNYRLEKKGSKELVELAGSYNQLAEALEKVSLQVQADGERILKASEALKLDGSTEFSMQPAIHLQDLLGTMETITEQTAYLQQAHRNLQQLAEKDSLTALLTQQAFEFQVVSELSRLSGDVPHSFYLLAFDNDVELATHGAELLPERLKNIANELKQALPPNMRICRNGETSFMFWGTHTDFSEGMKLAVKIHQLLQGLQQDCSMSLGLSSVIGEEKRYELLYSEAERALLRAQSDGGAKVYEY